MAWQNFIAPNFGLLVYKRLYTESTINNLIKHQPANHSEKEKLYIDISKEDKTTPFDSFYKALFDMTLSAYTQIENPVATAKFHLKTTYPGLLCGTGYTHDSNAKGDIKIGFYFDHTTGQPVIPGSSIKGVLKSIFENEYDKTDDSSLSAWKFIIGEIINDNTPDKAEWESLSEAFGNAEQGKKLLGKIKASIFGKQDQEGADIFFDAMIDIEKTGRSRKFLSNDFITPHKDPLKNPTPLMFLKVLPNIVFEFRFLLNEFSGENNFIITAKQKETIFQKIIFILGLGAKTNVGYGQFREEEKQLNPGKTFATIQAGDVLNAKITDLKNMKFDLGFKDMKFEPRLTGLSPSGFQVGQVVKVKVESVGKATRFSLIKH